MDDAPPQVRKGNGRAARHPERAHHPGGADHARVSHRRRLQARRADSARTDRALGQLVTADPVALLDLVDWRRRVGDLYRIGGPDALEKFREGRDRLFKSHPQSPLEPHEPATFTGLHYFPHDPAYRVQTRIEPADGSDLLIDTGGDDGAVPDRSAGRLPFRVAVPPCRLTV